MQTPLSVPMLLQTITDGQNGLLYAYQGLKDQPKDAEQPKQATYTLMRTSKTISSP